MNQFQVKFNDVFETQILEFEHRPVVNEFVSHKGQNYVIKAVLHQSDVKVLSILFVESIK